MKKYFFLWLTAITICATLFSACKKNEVCMGIYSEEELTLAPGRIVQLYDPYDYSFGQYPYPSETDLKSLIWTSSNPAVATVSDGMLTTISDGKTIVTLTTKNGEKSAEWYVMVDYRANWTGYYYGDEEYTYWSQEDTCSTEIYKSAVDVTLIGDSSLGFWVSKWGSSRKNSYVVKVNYNGSFLEHSPQTDPKPLIAGNICRDSLEMVIYHSFSPEAGAYSTFKGSYVPSISGIKRFCW